MFRSWLQRLTCEIADVDLLAAAPAPEPLVPEAHVDDVQLIQRNKSASRNLRVCKHSQAHSRGLTTSPSRRSCFRCSSCTWWPNTRTGTLPAQNSNAKQRDGSQAYHKPCWPERHRAIRLSPIVESPRLAKGLQQAMFIRARSCNTRIHATYRAAGAKSRSCGQRSVAETLTRARHERRSSELAGSNESSAARSGT